MVSFFEYCFFEPFFCKEQLQCLIETLLAQAKVVTYGFVKRARFAVNDILILFMDCDSLYFETRLLSWKEKIAFIKRVNKGWITTGKDLESCRF